MIDRSWRPSAPGRVLGETPPPRPGPGPRAAPGRDRAPPSRPCLTGSSGRRRQPAPGSLRPRGAHSARPVVLAVADGVERTCSSLPHHLALTRWCLVRSTPASSEQARPPRSTPSWSVTRWSCTGCQVPPPPARTCRRPTSSPEPSAGRSGGAWCSRSGVQRCRVRARRGRARAVTMATAGSRQAPPHGHRRSAVDPRPGRPRSASARASPVSARKRPVTPVAETSAGSSRVTSHPRRLWPTGGGSWGTSVARAWSPCLRGAPPTPVTRLQKTQDAPEPHPHPGRFTPRHGRAACPPAAAGGSSAGRRTAPRRGC